MKVIIDIDENDLIGICNLTKYQLSMLPVEVAEILLSIKNGEVIKNEEQK